MPPETQKDAMTCQQSNASFQQNISQNSIPQATTKKQVRECRGSRRGHKVLKYASKVYSFAIKCYDEQMPNGWNSVAQLIRQVDKTKYHIIAICHYKDLITDGIWTAACTKRHYHIIIRCTSSKQRVHVYTILRMLGIVYRPGKDDDIWNNHGVETIGDYTGYAMYLTHETRDAITDGKELYDITELISNLTIEEIEQVRSGYTRLIDSSKRLTTPELEALDNNAKQIGYELKNFEEWYDSQPFIVRSNAKMKTIRESYDRGVSLRIEQNSQICRLCVFIHGVPNTGKTYAAEKALAGLKIFSIGGGGTGKLDGLRADHDAIIIDDDVCPNILNMSDNKICRAYRRNKNNPPWAGKYLIVTSNLTFRAWAEKCGVPITSRHYDALLSRFCIGQILPSTGNCNQLYMEKVSDRGSTEIQLERRNMLYNFLCEYNKIIATYDPKKVRVDYTNLVIDIRKLGISSIT